MRAQVNIFVIWYGIIHSLFEWKIPGDAMLTVQRYHSEIERQNVS